MNNQTTAEERKAKGKILPFMIWILQSFFICQIIGALVAIVIGLPIGLNNNTGENIFYGGGFGAFALSQILLVVCIVFLLIGGKRLEKLMLRDNDKKFTQMLIGSITTILLIVGGAVVILVEVEEIWSFIVFGIVNLLAGAIFSGHILFHFEKMIRKATEKSLSINEDRFLLSRKLLFAIGGISICFAVAITIILAINSDRVTIIDQILICHFVGMLIHGITGEIITLKMKKQWIG